LMTAGARWACPRATAVAIFNPLISYIFCSCLCLPSKGWKHIFIKIFQFESSQCLAQT
jgi:hypothetical protein